MLRKRKLMAIFLINNIKQKREMIMKDKYFYIYDLRQALFFIQNGAHLIDIAKGNKGDLFHKFPRDEKHDNLFMAWKRQKYGDNAI
jgi:hypothetical protein